MQDISMLSKEFLNMNVGSLWINAEIGKLSHQGVGDSYLYKKENIITHFYTQTGNYVGEIENSVIAEIFEEYPELAINNDFINHFF